MRIDKNLVRENFSKGARTYDKYANIQKYMALQLEGLIGCTYEEKNVLEIGCGTGYLSRKLIEHFPNSNIDLLDISESMLEKTRESVGIHENINYILGDAETYQFDKKYDLIISNAVLQWIENPKELFRKFRKILKENGVVSFATFGKETYKELSESFNAVEGNSRYTQNFPSLKNFMEICRQEYMLLYAKEEYKIEKYSRVLDFLKHINGIGANCAFSDKSRFTKSKLELLETKYRDRYSIGKYVYATNHILYMAVQKIN